MGYRENRIGHFNPGLQGPNEPSAHMEGRIEELQEEIEALEDTLDMCDKGIAKYTRAIEENQRMLEREKSRKARYEGELAENREWLKGTIESVDALKAQKQSILIEIEVLEEDPGNEERIEQLKLKLAVINNNL